MRYKDFVQPRRQREVDRETWADVTRVQFDTQVRGSCSAVLGPYYFGETFENPPFFSYAAVPNDTPAGDLANLVFGTNAPLWLTCGIERWIVDDNGVYLGAYVWCGVRGTDVDCCPTGISVNLGGNETEPDRFMDAYPNKKVISWLGWVWNTGFVEPDNHGFFNFDNPTRLAADVTGIYSFSMYVADIQADEGESWGIQVITPDHEFSEEWVTHDVFDDVRHLSGLIWLEAGESIYHKVYWNVPDSGEDGHGEIPPETHATLVRLSPEYVSSLADLTLTLSWEGMAYKSYHPVFSDLHPKGGPEIVALPCMEGEMPCCAIGTEALLSTNVTLAAFQQDVTVSWELTGFDTAGFWSASNPTLLTATVDGIYSYFFHVLVDQPPSGSPSFGIDVLLPGLNVYDERLIDSAVANETRTISGTVFLSAGQSLILRIYRSDTDEMVISSANTVGVLVLLAPYEVEEIGG